MSDLIGGDRASSCPLTQKRHEFGVLFVDGFREQSPGSAIALLAGALYRWLFYWNARPDPRPASLPVLSNVMLSSAGGQDDQPAHLILSVPLRLSTKHEDARWLMAESSWADLFTTPRFLGLARWIWKVSTCLLVLQFVTPMRRRWRASGLGTVLSHRCRRPGSWDHSEGISATSPSPWQAIRSGVADGAMALVYLVLMGFAAMLSVLLATLLLAVALAAYLPIPRIDKAVRWVVVHISAMLGDSYMLAHCPVQFAAMRTKVARDLSWLQEHCDKVAIVAHSQGAALAHRVLKERNYRPDGLKAFITLGQGISKFDLMWRLDWDPRAQQKAQRSRVLVTLGMVCAGLPAVGLVVGHWASVALFKSLISLPWWPLLIIVGFAGITWGVIQAMRAVCEDVEQDFGLPGATFSWSDYYASADPVSNGPLARDARKEPLLPRPCNEVYNSGSVAFDHNGYLRNQDELLPSLLNDLVAAAYGEGNNEGDNPARWPELVYGQDVTASSQRRRRLLRGLVAARIATVGLLATLLWANPGRSVKHPMSQLMHFFTLPAGMGSDTARLLAALLLTAPFYAMAIIVWRAAVRRSVRLFFRDADFPTPKTRSEQDTFASQATLPPKSSSAAGPRLAN